MWTNMFSISASVFFVSGFFFFFFISCALCVVCEWMKSQILHTLHAFNIFQAFGPIFEIISIQSNRAIWIECMTREHREYWNMVTRCVRYPKRASKSHKWNNFHSRPVQSFSSFLPWFDLLFFLTLSLYLGCYWSCCCFCYFSMNFFQILLL